MISVAPGARGDVRCHCCGRDCSQAGALRRVYGGGDTGMPPVWSCEQHILRTPCVIEGCGRTYRLEPDESYGVRVVCGRHWRMAPRYMRDATARIRRLARRHGWTEALLSRHHRLWNRCMNAVRKAMESGIDFAEIERQFGPIGGP